MCFYLFPRCSHWRNFHHIWYREKYPQNSQLWENFCLIGWRGLTVWGVEIFHFYRNNNCHWHSVWCWQVPDKTLLSAAHLLLSLLTHLWWWWCWQVPEKTLLSAAHLLLSLYWHTYDDDVDRCLRRPCCQQYTCCCHYWHTYDDDDVNRCLRRRCCQRHTCCCRYWLQYDLLTCTTLCCYNDSMLMVLLYLAVHSRLAWHRHHNVIWNIWEIKSHMRTRTSRPPLLSGVQCLALS